MAVEPPTLELTAPVSFLSAPEMQLTSVLLPEPLGPISPTRSPVWTARSMQSSATKPPKRLPSLSISRRCPPCQSLLMVLMRPRGLPSNSPTMPLGAAMTNPTISTPTISRFEGGGDGDGGDLLDSGEQDGADHGSQPHRGAADQRHGDAVDREGQVEAGGGIEIGDVIGQRRPRHAHQPARQGRRDQFQLQRWHAGRLGGELVVADGGKAVAELRMLDRAGDADRKRRQHQHDEEKITGYSCRRSAAPRSGRMM